MHSPQSSEAEPILPTKSNEIKNKKQARNSTSVDITDASKVESTKSVTKKCDKDAKQDGALLSRISNSEDNSCKPENKGQTSNSIFQDKAAPTQWSSLLCKHYLFGRCARKRCRFLHAEPPVNPFIQLANPDNEGNQNSDLNRRVDEKQNGSTDNQNRNDETTLPAVRDRSINANTSSCSRGQQSHFKSSRTVLVSTGSTSPNQYHNPQRISTSEHMINPHSEQQKVMPPPPNNLNGKKNQAHYYTNNTLDSPPPPPASHMVSPSLNAPSSSNAHQASPYSWLRRKPESVTNNKISQLHTSLLPNINTFGMPDVHDHSGIIRQYPQYSAEPLVRDTGFNSRRNFAFPQNASQKIPGNNSPLLPTSTTLSDIRFVKAAETLADKYNLPFVCVYFPTSGYLIQFTSPKNPLVDQRILYQKNSGATPQVPFPPQRYPPEGHVFDNEILINENNAEREGSESNSKDEGHNRHIEELLKSMSLCQPLVHQAKPEEPLNTPFDENQLRNQDISLLNSKSAQMNGQLLVQPPSSQRLSVDRFRAQNSNGENPIKIPQVSLINKDGMQSIGEPTTAPADDDEQILSMVSCNSTESGANRCSSSHSGFFIDSATEESNNACNGYVCDPNCSKPSMFMLSKADATKGIWQPTPPPPPPHEPPKNVIPNNGGLYNQMPLQPPQQPFWLPSLDALEGECAPQWARQRHNEGIDMNTYAVKSTESSENAWTLGSKHLFAAFQDVKMVPEGSCFSGNIKGSQTCATTCLTNHANMGDLAQLSPTAALIAAIWGAEEQPPSQIPTHSK